MFNTSQLEYRCLLQVWLALKQLLQRLKFWVEAVRLLCLDGLSFAGEGRSSVVLL
jgi:hypothetical protein